MLSVKNLSFSYSLNTKLNFPDWEVGKKDHALILGESGHGKTTLLHLLGGLLRPKSGEIVVNGTSIQNMSSSQLDHFRGSHMGFVFQRPHLISSLSVSQNLKLATYLGNKTNLNKRIPSVLSDLGIRDLAHRKVHEISQGQAQRVAIARAVINEPDVIFGDEPTASLDDKSCSAVIHLLKKQAESCNATLIIATHDQRVKSEFENQLTL